jgi:S-adenosylmethionine:diacylglycerol 3-amino-3-carboxypropyl transferase
VTPATPWESGRFDTRGGPKKILFGRMYEDAAIEVEAFAPAAHASGSRVFCIASAGCTAMQLAERYEVTAVDINPVQLDYAKARLAGAPMRLGAAERIVGMGRTLLARFGWRRATLAAFLALDEPAEQVAFWRTHLDTRGFRIATDALFSITSLRRVYAAPFLAFLPDHFGRIMRARLERCFATHPNRTNVYARALLAGEAIDQPPPQNAPIQFECADAATYLERCPPSSFAGFTLSNILDGASNQYRARLFAAVRRAATPEAVVVLRSFAEPAAPTATNVAAHDRSILWGIVDVKRVSEL